MSLHGPLPDFNPKMLVFCSSMVTHFYALIIELADSPPTII